jgi:serpin B
LEERNLLSGVSLGSGVGQGRIVFEQFVQGLYQSELGRSGTRAEVDGWAGMLDGTATSQAAVVSGIAASVEARDHLVKGWYQTYLGRQANGIEEQGFVSLLLAGRPQEQVQSLILSSAEFISHAQTLVSTGTQPQRFVQALDQVLLGRTADGTELDAQVGNRTNLSPQSVALAFLHSPEYRSDMVMHDYVELLRRQADSAGLQGWVGSGMDLGSVSQGFERSPEFVATVTGSATSTPGQGAGTNQPPAGQSSGTSSGSSSTSQAPLTPAQQAAAAINQTGVDLFLRLAQKNPGANLSFSPFSLSTALAMLYAGARGQTAEQMAEVLNFLPAGDSLHADFAALLQALNAEGNTSQDLLRTANALWVQQGYSLQPDFVQLLQNDYGSGVSQEDFRGATEQARQAINSWVSQQTDGKIPELLPSGSVNPGTRLVLTNAVYFHAAWSEPFDTNRTFQQTFHVAPGQDVQTPMMHQTGSFGYYDGGDFTALSMDYQGGNQSMVILLPSQTDGLVGLEQELTAAKLTNVVSQMQHQQVDVSLPSFQVQQSLTLNGDLAGMGMPLAFSSQADFSGINGGAGPLQVSLVQQDVFVKVTEQGTEAAAATAVGIVTLAISSVNPPPLVFQADHPFVYLIRDNSTGAILFMGQITNPA